uniref:SWIM-type domain-containing protein n=1 Tax=Lactuca sativa TaxID=4236 RepID=A0A9R1X3H1_LACSA|nr:hypothetical protein LSAT_V11C600321330 [Lactuca sativa]
MALLNVQRILICYLLSLFKEKNTCPPCEAGHPTMFSIELHHGGKFTKFPGIKYIEGVVAYIDVVDIEEFSIHEMDSIMLDLGYVVPPVIYYHFRLPNEGLDFGLRALGNDDDVRNLSKYVSENKLIKVYTEHGETTLVTYFMSPNCPRRVIIEEIEYEEPPQPVSPTVGLTLARYGSFTLELSRGRGWKPTQGDQVDLVTTNADVEMVEKSVNEGVEEGQPIANKGVEEGCTAMNKQHQSNEVPFEDNYSVEEEMLEDFDPFYGYSKKKTPNMANVDASSDDDSESSEDNSEDSEDGDFMVDEDNLIPDIEVDMGNFHMGIDTDAEYLGSEYKFHEGNDVQEEVEDIEVINNDEWDSMGEDSDNDSKRREIIKQLGKERVCSHGEVHKVAFHTRRNICFTKNDKHRLTSVCKGTVVVNASGVGGPTTKKVKGKEVIEEKAKCTWRLHASRANDNEYWFIESNPGVPIRAIQEELQRNYEVSISGDKVFRAKALATKMVVGDYIKQYAVLRDYVLELQETNVDTTVKIQVESEPNCNNSTRQFKRMYVCLGALKKGFKIGMRDFLGLDGAIMKGPFPGQILTVVGVDSNNGIYPLAYAIVETENTDSWKWFLECLGNDLDMHANSNFTFISDRQKGLIPAIAQIFHCAEHRYCLRHIYENMRKVWRTTEYKEHLWNCAKATTIPEFETLMREFISYDMEAAMSDMLLNNLCEVFNSKLVKGRDKPIITCLEFIREYLMKRVCNVMKVINKCTGPLTPTGERLLQANISSASQYTTRWNGVSKYQVKGAWHDQHVVDIGQMTCSCRKWELTGMPCKHAIATINEMADNGEQVGELYTYVHKVYWLETWKSMYSFTVDPIKGRSIDCPTTLTPPPHHKQPGRPKKKRRQTADEKSVSQSQKENPQQGQCESQKLTRKFVSVTCSKCKNKGHNARTCKGKGGGEWRYQSSK